MIGALPKSLTVAGTDYPIRSDYRDVLTIISAFNDPDLDDQDKVYCCLYILYPDFDDIPQDCYEEAFKQAVGFLDCGRKGSDRPSKRIMDWEQDESLLFPAVNKIAGYEVRAVEYLHWWTFMGYFMEITDGVYSYVLNLRSKKAHNKKLDKSEQDFWSANKEICKLHAKLTTEEQAAKDRLNKLIGN